MSIKNLLALVASCLISAGVWAAGAVAPAVPDLSLPNNNTTANTAARRPAAAAKPVVNNQQKQQPAPRATATAAKQTAAKQATNRASSKTKDSNVIAVTNESIKKGGEYVEKVNPDLSKLAPLPDIKDFENSLKKEAAEEAAAEDMVPARSTANGEGNEKSTKVVYKPTSPRDPTLSADDALLLAHHLEEKRRKAEAERQRRLEAERRRIAELERQRELELEYLRDPSREVRGKIRINGIIGQEVFIGSKVYTVGQSVLGARIVSVQPDAVVFTYKGQKFTKKVQLQ